MVDTYDQITCRTVCRRHGSSNAGSGHRCTQPGPLVVVEKALLDTDGLDYFEKNIKGALLPPLAGKLVSATPSDHPSVLVLAMDGDEPQVTLRLTHGYGPQEARMPKPMALGSLITFEGVGISFTQEQFMLTLEVDTDEHPLDK